MSWSLGATGATREEALRNFIAALDADVHCTIKSDVKAAAIGLGWTVPDSGKQSYSSSGHLNTDGTGYASIHLTVAAPAPA